MHGSLDSLRGRGPGSWMSRLAFLGVYRRGVEVSRPGQDEAGFCTSGPEVAVPRPALSASTVDIALGWVGLTNANALREDESICPLSRYACQCLTTLTDCIQTGSARTSCSAGAGRSWRTAGRRLRLGRTRMRRRSRWCQSALDVWWVHFPIYI